jgi:hypothetical protein
MNASAWKNDQSQSAKKDCQESKAGQLSALDGPSGPSPFGQHFAKKIF